MKYAQLCELYERLEGTTKRLEKTVYVGEFLRKTPKSYELVLLIEGLVFPQWDSRKVGVASRLLLKALSLATGIPVEKIEDHWKEIGDLGEVAAKLVEKRKQSTLFSQELTVNKVRANLEKLAEMSGEGMVDKKLQLIAELLTSATPLEAKYVLRTIIYDLRIGLGEGVMRDSLVYGYLGEEIGMSYDKEENKFVFKDDDRSKYDEVAQRVEDAYNLTNDFAEVAQVLATKGQKGLSSITLKPGRPMKVMLYPKAESAQEAMDVTGAPAVCEFKLDGFRLQIHKTPDGIKMFTRGLEEVSAQFTDIVAMVKKSVKAKSVILDSEAVGIDAKSHKYLPFQSISQRIKRKYDIEELAQKFPVELNVFDVLYLDGNVLIDLPLSERREILEKIVIPADRLKIIEQSPVTTVKSIETYYKKSLAAGNEGVMVKNLTSIYQPGKRVGYGVKLKPVMETLDVVIIGGEWGEGKRSSWISSFIIACRDESGGLVEVGRVATGLKEKDEEGTSFGQMTQLLEPLITSKKGKEVTISPKIVIEVAYEEIQKSPTYTSGFALRFPRFLRLRTDRSVEDASDLELVQKLFDNQRGRDQ